MSILKTTVLAAAVMAMLAGTSVASAQANAPADGTVPKSDSLTGTTFSTPTSGSGLSPTPAAPGAYDLAGIGRRDTTQELILTEPVSGVPLRMNNGVFIFPSLLLGVGHNDNVTGVNVGKVSSTVLSVQPRMVAELKKSGDRYTLTYNGNLTRYTNSSADNYNNHDLTLAGDNYFSARSRLGWSAGYMASADARGATDRVQSAEPDRWHAPVLQGLYIYGAKGAQGRFELEGALQNKRYDNNRLYTVGSDVDTQSIAGRFLVRIMPKTAAVFELRHINSDYKQLTSFNDNTDNRYLVGLTWDAAAKTTGSIKVGHQSKNFDNPLMRDVSGGTFEGSLKWSPLTYSVVDLTTGRSASDSTGTGDYVMNTGTNLVWNHRWKSYLLTRAVISSVRSDYAGAGRVDTTRNMGLGVFYEFGRNMRVGLELSNTRRSSNQSIYDFKRNTTFVSLEGTL